MLTLPTTPPKAEWPEWQRELAAKTFRNPLVVRRGVHEPLVRWLARVTLSYFPVAASVIVLTILVVD